MIQYWPQSRCLVAREETKANVCCSRLPLHLSREGLYYSPRAANHIAVDTIRLLWLGIWHKKIQGGQFYQAHLQAAGRGAEPIQSRKPATDFCPQCLISTCFVLEIYDQMSFLLYPLMVIGKVLHCNHFSVPTIYCKKKKTWSTAWTWQCTVTGEVKKGTARE